MNFGEYLKNAREHCGISQKQLADKLGVPASMISRYESTDTEPRVGLALKIIQTLNITPNMFWGYTGKPHCMSLGDKLKQIREDANLSESAIAKKLNIPASQYQQYENNERFPCVSMIENIFFQITGTPFHYSMLFDVRHTFYMQIFLANADICQTAHFDIDENSGNIIFVYPELKINKNLTFNEFNELYLHVSSTVRNIQENVKKELFTLELVRQLLLKQKNE